MTIPEWMERVGQGARMRLVRGAGISPGTATALSRGERLKSYETAKRVSEATSGDVPVAAIWLDPMAAEREAKPAT